MQKLPVILVVIKLYSRIDILKICEILKKNAVEKISFGQKKCYYCPLKFYSGTLNQSYVAYAKENLV